MTEELSPSGVARRLGTTTRTVQRWIVAGTLPARRVGGRWRVATDALVAFERPGPGRSLPARAPFAAASPPRRPIRRLFIANRGEIAVRIRRTAERLGIVAIVPDTDGPAAIDLLDIGGVVATATAAGADAVHPGFGFLAENAAFAEAVVASGMAWIGPPPAAIRAMGDKAAARRLASELGVPVVPGYDDADQRDAVLVAAAERIGAPLLVKPAAGGGGKGMRTVRDLAMLPDALATARREALAAFGDDRLVLERLIDGPRHVEIQVLFDELGTGVHLGERDCSIQRRRQKILEETPSPAVDPVLRARMGEAALALARAVGYASAGTVEFLLADDGTWQFLEMNTRLQVEHPVTELVTGLDLVALQLRIAAGEPLGLDQATLDRVRRGHAVEVRLYAEDAEAGFLPATGRIEHLRWPGGEGIRVDAGVAEGDVVSARFDPMLAKIVAWGADRAAALARLAAALDETVVLGLVTNLRFLRWLVRQPVVLDGEARIDTLERLSGAAPPPIPAAGWTAAAQALLPRTAAGDPWSGGWRLNAPATVLLAADDGSLARASPAAAGSDAALPMVALAGPVAHVDVDGRSVAIRLAPPPDPSRTARPVDGSGGAGGRTALVAPMPGSVLAVHVAAGAQVGADDPIVTLEAMKMEHVVAATAAGTVTELGVRVGDQVVRGQRLATVET